MAWDHEGGSLPSSPRWAPKGEAGARGEEPCSHPALAALMLDALRAAIGPAEPIFRR